MSKNFEGMLLGKGLKLGLVISRFNEFISKKLLDGARDALTRHGVDDYLPRHRNTGWDASL